ncbi:hypothetical protein BGZ54_008542 [Gamsiella multidivaricata]|nr:hypothetical protein BGZ54_008542 [Gamsiella multidivaricata]
MATTSLTAIPSTQPSCGPISVLQPIPHCPSTNATSDPLGCFIQPTGLFCAPLSTTRGFRYSLEPFSRQSNSTGNTTAGTTNSTSSTGATLPHFILSLSTATNDNTTNPSPPLLGVDGQPVNYEGPARLGQTCIGIPLPATTDPLFQTLVSIANQRLNDTTGFLPGVGAGQDVFKLRGDCEQGSYCDPTVSSAGAGTCREQLPNFHNCTSYMQCISQRCDEPPVDIKIVHRRKRSTRQSLLDIVRQFQSQEHTIERRADAGFTVCLPSRIERGGGTGSGVDPDEGQGAGGSQNGGKTSPKFPAWMGAIIAMIVILGAAFIFGLARRRKKLRDEEEKKRKKGARVMMGRDRERHMVLSSSIQDEKDEKDEYLYQMGPEYHQPGQDMHRLGFLGALFSKRRKSSNDGRRTAAESSKSVDAMSTRDGSIISMADLETQSHQGDGHSFEAASFHTNQAVFAGAPGKMTSPFDPPGSPSTELDPNDISAAAASNSLSPASRLSVVIPRITTATSEPQIQSPSTSESPTSAPPSGQSRHIIYALEKQLRERLFVDTITTECFAAWFEFHYLTCLARFSYLAKEATVVEWPVLKAFTSTEHSAYYAEVVVLLNMSKKKNDNNNK